MNAKLISPRRRPGSCQKCEIGSSPKASHPRPAQPNDCSAPHAPVPLIRGNGEDSTCATSRSTRSHPYHSYRAASPEPRRYENHLLRPAPISSQRCEPHVPTTPNGGLDPSRHPSSHVPISYEILPPGVQVAPVRIHDSFPLMADSMPPYFESEPLNSFPPTTYGCHLTYHDAGFNAPSYNTPPLAEAWRFGTSQELFPGRY